MYRRFIKRPMDIVLSLLALIILSPVMLIVALLVRIKLGSPVIFKQKRPGLDEKIFTLYKFRTMTDKRDDNGELLPDSIRLTKFGRLLRSTSLDELPELI
ncbi:MAG: sugar transferase, partial [Clostridiales bacterium]|nr:sugar transferase [Clostridiales bacterium]